MMVYTCDELRTARRISKIEPTKISVESLTNGCDRNVRLQVSPQLALPSPETTNGFSRWLVYTGQQSLSKIDVESVPTSRRNKRLLAGR